MSGAGVHSSRGDGYQITIAADWAIRALSESIDWIELDSTDVDALGQRIAVDDVIITRAHQPRIYCQCKKNHPAHASWTVPSLRDDLEKAGRQLSSDSEAWVYFYSQNNFGELSAFQEYAATQPNAGAFSTDLPERFHKVQADLAECWSLSLSKAKETMRCLYYAYQGSFARIAPFLDQMEKYIDTDAGAVWGRICALAVLSGHIDRTQFFLKIDTMKNEHVWRGAVSVFAANAHLAVHSAVCFEGLQNALVEPRAAEAAVKELSIVFGREPAIDLPKELILRNFRVLYGDENRVRVPMYKFQKWLAKRVLFAPDEALDAAEIALGQGAKSRFQMWDDEHYPTLLTRLFREGEEREELDKGSFLKRTILLQDMLIQLDALRMNEWLKDAERPS